MTPTSDPRVANWLSESASNHVEDFLDVAIGVALLGCRADAALDVVLEYEQGNRVDRGPKRRRLLQDVDAVLPTLDHALDAPNLTFDAAQPANQDRLVARIRVPEGWIQLGRVGPDVEPLDGRARAYFVGHVRGFFLSRVVLRAAALPVSSIIPPGSIRGKSGAPSGAASIAPSG